MMENDYSLQKDLLKKNPNIVVYRSPIHRWGVFATDDIKKYDILEESPYFIVPMNEIEYSPSCHVYTYSFSDDSVIIGLGFAGIYNHNSDSNADYEIDKINEVMRHYATRDIEAGEEITLDYGEENVEFFDLDN